MSIPAFTEAEVEKLTAVGNEVCAVPAPWSVFYLFRGLCTNTPFSRLLANLGQFAGIAQNAAEEWHANWNPNNHPAPTGNDIGYIRTFLGWTYSECKFRAPPPPVVDTAEIEKLDQKVLERAAALQSLNAEETNVREQLRIGEYPSDPTLQLSQQQIATLHTRAQHLMREIADAFVLLQLAVEARSQAKLPSPLRM